MRQTLILVKLSPLQISQAKAANRQAEADYPCVAMRVVWTIFGTEKQCRKYFSVWNPSYKTEVAPGKFKALFPALFDKAVETDRHEIREFKTTFNLINRLIEA